MLEFLAQPRLGREERKNLKASRYSDARKAFLPKQDADGVPVAETCRKTGISQGTCFDWKNRHDGLLPTEI